jgi:hypothetical protein
MSAGGLVRPKIRAEDYGLPMRCPKPECGFGWLKLPGLKMILCPNCGGELVSTRPKRKRGID